MKSLRPHLCRPLFTLEDAGVGAGALELRVRRRVEVRGVESSPELNGQRGWVVRRDPKRDGRWGVLLDGGARATYSFRAKHLRVLDDTAGGGGGGGGADGAGGAGGVGGESVTGGVLGSTTSTEAQLGGALAPHVTAPSAPPPRLRPVFVVAVNDGPPTEGVPAAQQVSVRSPRALAQPVVTHEI